MNKPKLTRENVERMMDANIQAMKDAKPKYTFPSDEKSANLCISAVEMFIQNMKMGFDEAGW